VSDIAFLLGLDLRAAAAILALRIEAGIDSVALFALPLSVREIVGVWTAHHGITPVMWSAKRTPATTPAPACTM
jgi:hypothetical protein